MNIVANDEGLLISVAEGDEQAFKALFCKYLPVLHSFVIRTTKSSSAAEDIIQNTFIRVWLNREKLSGINNIQSWLFKCASNECLNYLRSEANQTKLAADGGAHRALSVNELWQTSGSVAVNEINQLINEAVSRLPLQRRRIYLLSRNEGLTIPEIAGELNVSPNTVKNALVISLKFIREFLSKYGYSFGLLYLLFYKN